MLERPKATNEKTLVRAYELCLWVEEHRNNDVIVKGLIEAAGISYTRKSHMCSSGSGRSMSRRSWSGFRLPPGISEAAESSWPQSQPLSLPRCRLSRAVGSTAGQPWALV